MTLDKGNKKMTQWTPTCGHTKYTEPCADCEDYDPPMTAKEREEWLYEMDEGLHGKHRMETDD